MCSKHVNIILLGIVLLLQVNFVGAQNSFQEIENSEVFSLENEIINGEIWVHQKKFEGHPFWKENIWYKGAIRYKNEWFENLNIRYDIFEDEIVLFKKVNDEGKSFKLNKTYLDAFSILDPNTNDSVYFPIIQLPGSPKKEIYAQIYDGESKFYIRYEKVINNIVSDNYTGEYLLKPRLIAKTSKDYLTFDSKSKFLGLFLDKKNDIKKFMRQNRIKYDKKNPENLGSVFEYFDSISKAATEN